MENLRIVPYNRLSALLYARRWAFARNPRYYNFDDLGGDCTNFASQVLFAGSGVMNYTPVFGWYYRSVEDRAPAWTGVEYLYNFLTTNEGVGPFAREVSEEEVEPGDLLQLGRADGTFYHCPVIVATRPEILVAAHSDDAYGRPLSSYMYDRVRFLHIEGVRK